MPTHTFAPAPRTASRVATMMAAAFFALACGGETRPADSTATSTTPTPEAATTPAPAAVPGPSATPMQSPDSFRVVFETSKGSFTVAVTRRLAPLGADRLYELVQIGYYNDTRFFRVVPGFVVQFGINGNPAVNTAWERATLADEPMRISNERGTVAFTTAGPNTRTTQLFINMGDNAPMLDPQQFFPPLGRVVEGLDVVERINSEYGEEPNQSRIFTGGNEYLMRWFPALDYIKTARIEVGTGTP